MNNNIKVYLMYNYNNKSKIIFKIDFNVIKIL